MFDQAPFHSLSSSCHHPATAEYITPEEVKTKRRRKNYNDCPYGHIDCQFELEQLQEVDVNEPIWLFPHCGQKYASKKSPVRHLNTKY